MATDSFLKLSKMGFVRSIGWMQKVGKKQCRSLYSRLGAAMRKAFKKRSKQQVKFQYDPYSYALNFDDGSHQETEDYKAKLKECPETMVWVYVVLAE